MPKLYNRRRLLSTVLSILKNFLPFRQPRPAFFTLPRAFIAPFSASHRLFLPVAAKRLLFCEYAAIILIARTETYRSGHNGLDSKSSSLSWARGFESHRLRHNKKGRLLPSFLLWRSRRACTHEICRAHISCCTRTETLLYYSIYLFLSVRCKANPTVLYQTCAPLPSFFVMAKSPGVPDRSYFLSAFCAKRRF